MHASVQKVDGSAFDLRIISTPTNWEKIVATT